MTNDANTATAAEDRGFPIHTLDSAPAQARPYLAATEAHFGFIPTALAQHAEAPAIVETFFHLLKVFERTSLAPLEREVVAMSVGRLNGCHVCVALHSGSLRAAGASPSLIEALRAGAPSGDERLDALAAFVAALLRRRGDVEPEIWNALRSAGYTHAQALEVVLGVATYVLSTFANRLAQSPVDPGLSEGAARDRPSPREGAATSS